MYEVGPERWGRTRRGREGNRGPFVGEFRGGRNGGTGCGEPRAECEELLAQATLVTPSLKLRCLSGELQSDGDGTVGLESGDGQLVLGCPGFGFRRFAGGKLGEQLEVFCSEWCSSSFVVGIFDFLLKGEPELIGDVLSGSPLWLEEGEKLSALGGEVGREAFNKGVLDAKGLGMLSAHLLDPATEARPLVASGLELGKQGPFSLVGLLEELNGGETLLDVDRGGAAPAIVNNGDWARGSGHSGGESRSSKEESCGGEAVVTNPLIIGAGRSTDITGWRSRLTLVGGEKD
jgi:hypothetical protein